MTMASAYPMLAPFRAGVAQTGAPSQVGDLAWNQVGGFSVTSRDSSRIGGRDQPGRRSSDLIGTRCSLAASRGLGVRDFCLGRFSGF